MRNKNTLKEWLDYFKTLGENKIIFDEEALLESYQNNADNQPLSVKILSVFGGFLASMAFMGFLSITGIYNSKIGLLMFGIGSIVGSIWLNKQYKKIIIDTISVSFFIIGFILLGLACNELLLSVSTVSLVFVLISLVVLSIVQNYVLSFISVIIINGSIIALILDGNQYILFNIYVASIAFILMYLFLNEAKFLSSRKMLTQLYYPTKIALLIAFIIGLVFLSKSKILPTPIQLVWLSSVAIFAAILYFVYDLFKALYVTNTFYKIGIYFFTLLILLPTVLFPAISGAILIILLSYKVNYKMGLVIGIVSLIYFISQFYYDLNLTLLTKSILLFSSGLLFLGLYFILIKKSNMQ